MSKPLILVTNDDGIAAPGLRALVEVAKTLGEVIIVAPDSPQSGQGHAITLTTPLRIHPVDIFDGIEAYECSGTPVDCVKLAKHIITKDRKIDFCVSGINHGSNAGVNIIYSGTMSAAMEASLEDIPSIGFSLLDYTWEADFSEAKPYVKQLIQYGLTEGLSPAMLLNVNIPRRSDTPIKGMKVCRQANARWVETFQKGTDPHGRDYYWLTGSFVSNDDGHDSDIQALSDNYISVVPSGHDLTHYQALEPLAPIADLKIED
jgi:5'-nucleotidase